MNFRLPMLAILVCAPCFASGCSQRFHVVDADQLSDEINRSNESRSVWFYLGSDGDFHYFRRQFGYKVPPLFSDEKTRFKVQVGQLPLRDQFDYDPNDTHMSKAEVVFRHPNPNPPPKYISRLDLSDTNE